MPRSGYAVDPAGRPAANVPGMLDIADEEVEAAVARPEGGERLCAGRAHRDNPAKQLAWSYLDRLPIVEAGGFLAPVARRWKTQLNENSKSWPRGRSCPRRPTTRSWAIRIPNRSAITSTWCSWPSARPPP